jgi:hypothetical protein
MGYGSSDELNYFLILIYMDIIEVCQDMRANGAGLPASAAQADALAWADDIKEDMHKIEEDSKKIDCYAILDLIGHCIQCFIDSIKCCFKIKVY